MLNADHAIVAVGIEPETLLAKESNLEIDQELGGYKVNEELEARLVFQLVFFPWRTLLSILDKTLSL